jgi:hypothetical protein
MKCSTELLLSAAFVLTPRDHWTKGAYQISTPKGPAYCVYGALIHAQVQRQCRPADFSRAVDALRRAVGDYITYWNDEIAKHKDVLNALYRAADIAEGA